MKIDWKTGKEFVSKHPKKYRRIVENAIGRKLDHNEVVHHKDGNNENNNLTNLMITTQEEHIRIHHQMGK